MKAQIRPKVFGIGFHKTGTSSLGVALELLGYHVCGMFGINAKDIERIIYEESFKLVDQYDAFQDNPWPLIYQELDQRYPNSKFILTVRPPEDWIRSTVKHYGIRDNSMRAWIYGVGHPKGNESRYLERYQRHNREVEEYFKNRPNDFLVLDITKGDQWDKLCLLLDKPIPSVDFPHENQASRRNSPLHRLIKKKIRSAM